MKNSESSSESTTNHLQSQAQRPGIFAIDLQFGEFVEQNPQINLQTAEARQIIQEAWKHGNSYGRNDFAEELENLISRADSVE